MPSILRHSIVAGRLSFFSTTRQPEVTNRTTFWMSLRGAGTVTATSPKSSWARVVLRLLRAANGSKGARMGGLTVSVVDWKLIFGPSDRLCWKNQFEVFNCFPVNP